MLSVIAPGDTAHVVKTDSWSPEVAEKPQRSDSPGACIPLLHLNRTRYELGWRHLEFRNPKMFAQMTRLPRALGLLLSQFRSFGENWAIDFCFALLFSLFRV